MRVLLVFVILSYSTSASSVAETPGQFDRSAPQISELSTQREGSLVVQLQTDAEDEEVILGLAHKLFEEKDYLRAAGEYVRFYRLFPSSPRAEEALFRAGVSYMEARCCEKAIEQFDTLEKSYPSSSPHHPQALYLYGQCLRSLGRLDEALDVWSRAALQYPHLSWGQQSLVARALSRGEAGDYPGALEDLVTIEPESPLHDSAQSMARELRAMDQLPRKNPAAAGILSALLPGAGQFYLGRYRHGFVALLLNGLTLWGGAEALENDDDGLAVALFILEAFWYSATIVGSVGAAYKMNREAEHNYFLDLERRYFFSPREEAGQNSLGLEIRFAF